MSQAEALLNSLTEVTIDHKHVVPDSDTYFIIDPYTRQIENTNYKKTVLMRGDHNSERFTFELSRYVDGHDMSLCNRVIIHFDNVGDSIENIYSDVAYMDDLQINPKNPDTVISSWLIRREATQIVGILSFSLQYQCVENGEVTYEWNTDSYDEIEIRKSKNNGEAAIIQYTNVLEQWRSQIFGAGDSVMANITNEGANQVTAVQTESATQQAAIELKGSETLASIPDDYTEVYNMATEAVRTKGDSVVCEAEGEIITLSDSSNDYVRGLKLYGKSTQFTTTGKNLWNGEYTNFAFGASSQSNNKLAIFQSDIYKSIIIQVTPGKVYSVSRGVDIWGRLYVGFTKEYPKLFDVVIFPDGQSGELVLGNYNYGSALNIPAITVPAECQYMIIYLTNDIMTYDVTQTWYQIEEGEEITAYEPYTGGIPSPNPEYPQEIESVESPTVGVYGSNLMRDNTGYKNTYNGLTCEYEGDGIYHIYGTYSGTNPSTQFADMRLDLPVDPNAKYTISAELIEGTPVDDFHPYIGLASDSVSHRNWMAVSVDNTTKIGEVKSTTRLSTDTVENPTTINKFWIYAYNDNLDEYTTDFRFRVWLTKSDAPIPYEPHTTQILAMSQTLRGIPVTSGGNYTDSDGQQWICDEVDLERGLYIQRLKTVVLNGSSSEYYYAYNTTADQGLSFVYVPHDGAMKFQSSICDKYRNVNHCWEKTYYGQTGIYSDHNSVTSKYFRPPNDMVNSLDAWKAWLAVNPLTLTYLLATPIETALTSEEIETFKSLRTNYPNTIILNDSGTWMKAKYNADTKLYISSVLDTGVANAVEEVLNDSY